MKETKFRIRLKDKTTGNPLTFFNSIFDAMNGVAFWQINRNEWEFLSADEWTGLHDMNDREIYENDIISAFRNRKGIVSYHTKRAAWIFQDGFNELLFQLYPVEVIGNIYEDTKLLNKEQGVQECDASKADSSTDVGSKK